EMPAVAGPEEPLGAAEQAMVVLVPAHSASGPEALADPVLVGEQRRDQLVGAQHVERAVLVCKRERVLVGQRVAIGLAVVVGVAAALPRTSGRWNRPILDG